MSADMPLHEPLAAMVSRRKVLFWVCLWACIVAVQVISNLWYPTRDGCSYLSIARSLGCTGQARNLGNPHLTYAVGYPFLLSLLYRFGVSSFVALSFGNALFAGVYVAGVFVWARRHVAEAALPIALLSVGNVIVLGLLRRTLSEAVFLPVMIWLVVALGAVRPERRRNALPMLAATLLLSALVLIRQAGMLFAVGFAIQLALWLRQRKITWKRALALGSVLTMPAVVAVSLMIAADQRSKSAQDVSNLTILLRQERQAASDYPPQTLPTQVVEGLRVRISELGRLLIPGMFNVYGKYGHWLGIDMLVYLPLAALVLFGWYRMIRQGPDAFLLTLPFYAALYVYWPFNQSGRYFAPLLPVLWTCCWFGLKRLGEKRQPVFEGLIVVHLLVAMGYWLAVDQPRAIADNNRWTEIRTIAEQIRARPGSVEVSAGLGNARLLLQYELDQRVLELPPGGEVDWLVAGSEMSGLVLSHSMIADKTFTPALASSVPPSSPAQEPQASGSGRSLPAP